MSVRRRAKEMNQNIRNSEVFPRIRDTERLMIEDEILFRKRRERKKKKQENLLKEQENGIDHSQYQEKNKKRLDSTHLPPITKKTVKSDRNGNNNTISPMKSDYFSSYVLNRDPNCSQYMPFNEVFYPNLFNPLIDSNNPHSIDLVWMLGFQHDALHKSIEVKVKKEFKS